MQSKYHAACLKQEDKKEIQTTKIVFVNSVIYSCNHLSNKAIYSVCFTNLQETFLCCLIQYHYKKNITSSIKYCVFHDLWAKLVKNNDLETNHSYPGFPIIQYQNYNVAWLFLLSDQNYKIMLWNLTLVTIQVKLFEVILSHQIRQIYRHPSKLKYG